MATWRPWEHYDHKAVRRGDLYMRYRPLPYGDYMCVWIGQNPFRVDLFSPFLTNPKHPAAYLALGTQLANNV